MFKKKNKFSIEHELSGFRLKLTESLATLETYQKDWSVSWSSKSDLRGYALLILLFNNKQYAEIEVIAKTLYIAAKTVLIDEKVVGDILYVCQVANERYIDSLPKETEESDEEILKQERWKQEHLENLSKEEK